jgi:hypothetical protein
MSSSGMRVSFPCLPHLSGVSVCVIRLSEAGRILPFSFDAAECSEEGRLGQSSLIHHALVSGKGLSPSSGTGVGMNRTDTASVEKTFIVIQFQSPTH